MEKVIRSYSAQTNRVLALLANEISIARKTRGYSETEMSERAGISRSTLRAIEAADPKVQIGVVFETAYLLGIPLLGDNGVDPARFAHAKEKLALLPKRIRKKEKPVNDDF